MTNTLAVKTDRDEVIRQTYLKQCTEAEASVFLEVCKIYGLDPIKKEIYPMKYGNVMQPVVSRDGLLSIAHNSGKFLGMKTTIIWEPGKEGTKEGCKGATCTVKTLGPTGSVIEWEETVWCCEYNTGKSTWVSLPITMIQKVAESHCLKRAFAIGNLYVEEEMPTPDPGWGQQERKMKEVPVEQPVLTEQTFDAEFLNLDTIAQYRSYMITKHRITEEQFKDALAGARISPGKWSRAVIEDQLKPFMKPSE